MANILVTGGAGYIGSHTVVELVKAGYNPVIIDNFSSSHKSVIARLETLTKTKIQYYEQDYQQVDELAKVLASENIDGVIHFAASKAVGESIKKPLEYYQNNVAGLINLLEVMEKCKIPSLVFSSSCVVYGEADKLPVSELSPVKPAASPYGATKQIGETIIHDVAHASSRLRSISLRYFNPIGAHPSGLIGELPIGVPSILLPFITQTVAGIHKQLTVFGNDYPTPDGTCIRDYIHVVDLARAHVQALKYLNSQHPKYYDVFNIGTGKGSSVLEVIKAFEATTGKKVPYRIGERRPGDIVTSHANADKAAHVLGWKAEKSLEDACQDAWRWQKKLINDKV